MNESAKQRSGKAARAENARSEIANPQSKIHNPQSEIQRLERAIRLSDRQFSLFLARCNVPAQRQQVVDGLRARLAADGIQIREFDLPSGLGSVLHEILSGLRAPYGLETPDPLPQGESALPEPLRDERLAFFVYGLERSLPSRETYYPALAVLNWQRELFRQALPGPLVLWLPEYALQLLAENAPDFWAWRSGTFRFGGDLPQAEALRQQLEPDRGQLALSRLTLAEKQERLALLQGLLDEYQAREDQDKPAVAAIRADLLRRIGDLQYYTGDYQAAQASLRASLSLWCALEDRQEESEIYNGLGLVAKARGDYAAAPEWYDKSAALKEQLGDRAGLAVTYNNIGEVHRARGDYVAALAWYDKSVVLKEQLGHRAGLATTYNNTGEVHRARGDYAAALAWYQKSLVIREQIGDRAGLATTYNNIGEVHRARGDYAAALAWYDKSATLMEQLGDRAGLAAIYNNIGEVHRARGDYAAALGWYGKSREIAEQIGARHRLAIVEDNLATIYQALGDQEGAQEHLARCRELYAALGLEQGGEGAAPQGGIT